MAQYPPHISKLDSNGNAVTLNLTDEVENGHPVYLGLSSHTGEAIRGHHLIAEKYGEFAAGTEVAPAPDPITQDEIDNATEANIAPAEEPVDEPEIVAPVVPKEEATV